MGEDMGYGGITVLNLGLGLGSGINCLFIFFFLLEKKKPPLAFGLKNFLEWFMIRPTMAGRLGGVAKKGRGGGEEEKGFSYLFLFLAISTAFQRSGFLF